MEINIDSIFTQQVGSTAVVGSSIILSAARNDPWLSTLESVLAKSPTEALHHLHHEYNHRFLTGRDRSDFIQSLGIFDQYIKERFPLFELEKRCAESYDAVNEGLLVLQLSDFAHKLGANDHARRYYNHAQRMPDMHKALGALSEESLEPSQRLCYALKVGDFYFERANASVNLGLSSTNDLTMARVLHTKALSYAAWILDQIPIDGQGIHIARDALQRAQRYEKSVEKALPLTMYFAARFLQHAVEIVERDPLVFFGSVFHQWTQEVATSCGLSEILPYLRQKQKDHESFLGILAPRLRLHTDPAEVRMVTAYMAEKLRPSL